MRAVCIVVVVGFALAACPGRLAQHPVDGGFDDAGVGVVDAGSSTDGGRSSDGGTTRDAGVVDGGAEGCGLGHCIDTTCTPNGDGYALCDNGAIHKVGPAHCALLPGTPAALCASSFKPDAGACVSSSECGAGTVCLGQFPGNEGEGESYPPCICAKRGCTSDDDCRPGAVCDCTFSQCVDASCAGPSDCATGVCAAWHPETSCELLDAYFACMSSTDSCNGNCKASQCAPVADGGCANPFGPSQIGCD